MAKVHKSYFPRIRNQRINLGWKRTTMGSHLLGKKNYFSSLFLFPLEGYSARVHVVRYNHSLYTFHVSLQPVSRKWYFTWKDSTLPCVSRCPFNGFSSNFTLLTCCACTEHAPGLVAIGLTRRAFYSSTETLFRVLVTKTSLKPHASN
jgi:hypothetical protein